METQNESADRDPLTPCTIGVDAFLQLRRLPSLSINPSQRTRRKKVMPIKDTQTRAPRAKVLTPIPA